MMRGSMIARSSAVVHMTNNLSTGYEEHKNVEKSGVAKLEPQRSIFARFTAPLMHSGHTPIRAGAHKIKP